MSLSKLPISLFLLCQPFTRLSPAFNVGFTLEATALLFTVTKQVCVVCEPLKAN